MIQMIVWYGRQTSGCLSCLLFPTGQCLEVFHCSFEISASLCPMGCSQKVFCCYLVCVHKFCGSVPNDEKRLVLILLWAIDFIGKLVALQIIELV